MNECVTCGRTMQPLFTGMFCPNDCDRGRIPTGSEEGILRASFQGMTWRVKRVKPNEEYPPWMTHSWKLFPKSSTSQDERLSDEELIRQHQDRYPDDSPGTYNPDKGKKNNHRYAVLAFGPDQEGG